MGFFDYLKAVFGQSGQERRLAWMQGSRPIFTSFGHDIYLSDFVNNAIDRVATEVSKIEIKSILQRGDILNVQNDDITRLFRFKPNPLQTTGDFLSNTEWLRRKHRNAFIYPQFEWVEAPNGRRFKRYTAFYPLKPSAVEVGVGEDGGAWEILLEFEDGSRFRLPYADLIHLKWRRGVNTVIGGGDDNGMANDHDTIRAIDALDKTIQGLPKSIEASLQIRGVYSTKSLMGEDLREKERADFESHIMKSSSGIVATDLSGEFTPVNINAPDIPDEAMRFLKAVIQEKYGVSAAILAGDFSSTQHNAFYQVAIEEVIVQLEQAMTACLFTAREQDVGRRIKCYYRKVRYYSVADKLNLAQLARETGIMTLNQINEMFGVEPFEQGNRRLQSLNYVNIENVDAYQKARAGAEDEESGATADDEE